MRYCGPFHRYSSISLTVFFFSLVYLAIYKLTLRTKTIIIPYNHDNLSQQDIDLNGNPLPDRSAADKIRNDTIYIAVASCERTGVNLTQTKRETTTLIKSILISASIDHLPHIELHFITNTDNLLKFYNETITKITKMAPSTRLDVIFHSANESVPVKHKEYWMTNFDLCSHAHLFLPTTLRQLTKILYLDTDTLITGSIKMLWKLFDQMEPTHAIGMGSNAAESTNYGDLEKKSFSVLPFVLPKGVSSGVLLMHLEKLRQFQWDKKVTSTLDKHIKFSPTDHHIINYILDEHPEILQIIPCNFKFMHVHCEKGLTCKAPFEDPIGIHLIHGAGGKFVNDSSPMYKIFESYEKAGMLPTEFKNSLFLSIKKVYTEDTGNSTCFGRLGPLLYKNIVVDGTHTNH